MSNRTVLSLILLISLSSFAGESLNSTMSEFKKILVENYYFSSDEAEEKSKKIEKYKKSMKSEGKDVAHFKTLSLNYFDSNSIKHYSDEFSTITQTILAYCLFTENIEIKKSCGSEVMRDKIDLLTEERYPGQDSGEWATTMSDLYEVSYIIEDGLATIDSNESISESVDSPLRENLKEGNNSGPSDNTSTKTVIKE
jgi:hypothetical protein